MDLFEYAETQEEKKKQPLAARMRPKTLDEYVGQKDVVGKGSLLYRAIMADKISSIILYGPPGTGKTTLAQVIAGSTKAAFLSVNATTAGKKDLEQVITKAQENRCAYNRGTILFIDEIHRFNKAQQDYLLPFVENGTVILIGATTENPYFEVNSALLSRSGIFELKPLSRQDIVLILQRALHDPIRGVAGDMVEMDEAAIEFLADVAEGDARAALNALELATLTTERKDDGKIYITLETARQCIQKRAIHYDKNGDQHYDVISAFIKSMRGSDADAVLYYLARLLEGGEDVKFIARRIMIAAAEECGNADPRALEIASAAAIAVERIGMPESAIILANAATYIACAPKSNAASQGIFKAMAEVRQSGNLPIPSYLRDAHYAGAQKLNRGIGYKYAHDYANHWVQQTYLPKAIKDKKFYAFSNVAYEERLKKYFDAIGKNTYAVEEPKQNSK